MNWKTLLIKKAIVERIPFAGRARNLKRKLFGYPPNLDYLEYTVENYTRIKNSIEKAGVDINGATILEIGTGWFPVIPILFARDGAKKLILTDLNVHMDDVTLRETITFLKNRFPEDAFFRNISELSDLPFEYLAPFNSSDLDDNYIDIATSHLVLEHIPESDIYNVFSSLRPKIKSSGTCVNLVDHSDHFEHYDKSISRIEFLTWNEEKHARINYLIKDGENRLRHHEYIQIFADSGFEVIHEEKDVDQKTLETVQSLDLAYPYSKMDAEQLAILTSVYTARPIV